MCAGSYADSPCTVRSRVRTRTRRRASVFEPPYLRHGFVFGDTLLATVYQTSAQDDNRNSGDTFANRHVANHEAAGAEVSADGPDVRRTTSLRPQIDGRENEVLADTSGDTPSAILDHGGEIVTARTLHSRTATTASRQPRE